MAIYVEAVRCVIHMLWHQKKKKKIATQSFFFFFKGYPWLDAYVFKYIYIYKKANVEATQSRTTGQVKSSEKKKKKRKQFTIKQDKRNRSASMVL